MQSVSAPVWASIPGYEGVYEASACGLIRSLERDIRHHTGTIEKRPGRLLTKFVSGKGYHYVSLSIKGARRQVGVHRLVALAFLGPSLGRHVNHLDLDKQNNRIENLEWATPSENALHAVRAGRYAVQHIDGQTLARNNPRRSKKLTPLQAEEIKRIANTRTRTQKDIASEFGITQSTVSKIGRDAIWSERPRIQTPSLS